MGAERESLLNCMMPHPSNPNLFCNLPVPRNELEHEGPHGWDYEAGEKAVITRRELERGWRERGLGWLVDRQHEIDAERVSEEDKG